MRLLLLVVSLLMLLVACQPSHQPGQSISWDSLQDTTDVLSTIEDGLKGPEAVRYDPAQDVYFISNFNGEGTKPDSNGFISRATPDGTIDSLTFMTGSREAPLHAPRGMYITGDTLWVADVLGVHGFHRKTGQQLIFHDFSEYKLGFLNDIAAGPGGSIYITDTFESNLYKISGSTISLVDSLPSPANGITVHTSSGNLVMAPWAGNLNFMQLNPVDAELSTFTNVKNGGNFDGIEFLNGRMLVASQKDTSLRVIQDNNEHILIKTRGLPADIGVDTKRKHVAIPYIALNKVDIWQLPAQ